MSISSSFYSEGLQKEQLASVAFLSSGKGATSTDVAREMTFTNISSLNGHIHKHRLLESTLNLQLLPMKLIFCTLR